MCYGSMSKVEPGHNHFSSSLAFLMTFSYSWFNLEQFIIWAGVPPHKNLMNFKEVVFSIVNRIKSTKADGTFQKLIFKNL